jgi:branched-chain amino acid transport system substrate-binding protein
MDMIRAARLGLAAAATGAILVGAAAPVFAKSIKLGVIMPLTGPAAVVGTQQMQGVKFAIDRQNAEGGVEGNKIDVIYEDDQAKSDQAVLDFNKLVDLEHVPLIFIGYSGPTLATAPLATRKKVLLVNAGAQSDKLGAASPYLINTLPQSATEAKVLVRYLLAHGNATAAVIYENDAAGIGARDDFVRDFKAAGGKILAQEPVQFGQTDYRPALLKLAAAKPQVLYVDITAGMVSLVDQLHQINHKWLVAGSTFASDPAAIADPASTGLIHTQLVVNASPALRAAFQDKMHARMSHFARQYYNAARIVLAVLDKVIKEKKPVTGPNLRAALFEIRTFHELAPITFTSNTATEPIAINEMRNGKDVTLTYITVR